MAAHMSQEKKVKLISKEICELLTFGVAKVTKKKSRDWSSSQIFQIDTLINLKNKLSSLFQSHCNTYIFMDIHTINRSIDVDKI